MPKPKDKDQPEAQRTEYDETAVPVEVGMDKDDMAKAETQNRQVGVDDSREIRDTLHDAAKAHGETVDIPVRHEAGTPLPEAARQAIADKDDKAKSSTAAGMPGAAPDDDDDDILREVSLNNRTYTWRKGEEGSVPKEAVEVWERSREANLP